MNRKKPDVTKLVKKYYKKSNKLPAIIGTGVVSTIAGAFFFLDSLDINQLITPTEHDHEHSHYQFHELEENLNEKLIDAEKRINIWKTKFERLENRLTDLDEKLEEKAVVRTHIAEYMSILSTQQNLMGTLGVYNKLHEMIPTKEGRKFIETEINNIKLVNDRLLKLRRQIYHSADKKDREIILESYQNLIRIYKPVIPKDELEKDIKNTARGNTTK